MAGVPACFSTAKNYFVRGLRIAPIVSVKIMMPGIFPLHLVLSLLSSPDPGPVPPGLTAQLPGGREAASRPPPIAPQPATPKPPVEKISGGSAVLPRLSSHFGRRGDPLRKMTAMHYGIDIPGALGTPVLASAPGVVRFAGTAGSYGGMIEIDHDGAIDTRYAHLSRILVRPGARVERGQPVALMGSTGRSTGSHLHFEVRVGGHAVDPLRYLAGDAPVPAKAWPAKAWIASDAPHISAFARARADEQQGRAF